MEKKIRVLVVDDAAFMRDLIKRSVRSQFPTFQIDDASNGKQAQHKLLNGEYELILCDWEMPEMTGDELLHWIRSREETATTPFVMITSRGDKEHVVKAVELGVNNYLVKPFTNDKLADVVSRVLSKTLKIPAAALRGRPAAAPSGIGNDSAAVLMGAQSRNTGLSGAVPVAAAPGAETAAPAKRAPERARPKQRVVAQLRAGETVLSCLVREVDLEQISVVIKRGDSMPQILELAAFDFETEDDGGNKTISRLNAYIHALQARDESQESEFVNVILRLIDDDPEKRANLQRYIASIQ